MSEGRVILERMPTVPQLLDFAAAHPVIRGPVEDRIRREFGITPARYAQLLHRAAASREGLAHDAITAHRVLRRGGTRGLSVDVGSG
jgi:hypothetical protein